MALSGFLGRRNLKNLDIEIHTPDEIFSGIKTPITVSLINKKKFLPSFLIKVYLKDNSILLPYINNNSIKDKEIFITFDKRGINKIETIKICSVFPFNFFIRCKEIKIDLEVLVFPKPKKCKIFSDDFNKIKQQNERLLKFKGYEGDLTGIRDYIKGDPLKLIHWKLSAKTDKLKTKELSSTGFQSVIINLDDIKGSIEDKISCATYQILSYYKRVIPFGLKIGKTLYKPEFSRKQKLKLLRVLALYKKD